MAFWDGVKSEELSMASTTGSHLDLVLLQRRHKQLPAHGQRQHVMAVLESAEISHTPLLNPLDVHRLSRRLIVGAPVPSQQSKANLCCSVPVSDAPIQRIALIAVIRPAVKRAVLEDACRQRRRRTGRIVAQGRVCIGIVLLCMSEHQSQNPRGS